MTNRFVFRLSRDLRWPPGTHPIGDVGPTRILQGNVDNGRLPISDLLPIRSAHAGYLTFNSDLVALKPREAVAVHADLLVYEVNELSQDVEFGDRFPVVHRFDSDSIRWR